MIAAHDLQPELYGIVYKLVHGVPIEDIFEAYHSDVRICLYNGIQSCTQMQMRRYSNAHVLIMKPVRVSEIISAIHSCGTKFNRIWHEYKKNCLMKYTCRISSWRNRKSMRYSLYCTYPFHYKPSSRRVHVMRYQHVLVMIFYMCLSASHCWYSSPFAASTNSNRGRACIPNKINLFAAPHWAMHRYLWI